jgi:hypothetical protein
VQTRRCHPKQKARQTASLPHWKLVEIRLFIGLLLDFVPGSAHVFTETASCMTAGSSNDKQRSRKENHYCAIDHKFVLLMYATAETSDTAVLVLLREEFGSTEHTPLWGVLRFRRTSNLLRLRDFELRFLVLDQRGRGQFADTTCRHLSRMPLGVLEIIDPVLQAWLAGGGDAPPVVECHHILMATAGEDANYKHQESSRRTNTTIKKHNVWLS